MYVTSHVLFCFPCDMVFIRVAGTHPEDLPWISQPSNVDVIDGYTWELYNETADPTQSVNLVSDNCMKI